MTEMLTDEYFQKLAVKLGKPFRMYIGCTCGCDAFIHSKRLTTYKNISNIDDCFT